MTVARTQLGSRQALPSRIVGPNRELDVTTPVQLLRATNMELQGYLVTFDSMHTKAQREPFSADIGAIGPRAGRPRVALSFGSHGFASWMMFDYPTGGGSLVVHGDQIEVLVKATQASLVSVNATPTSVGAWISPTDIPSTSQPMTLQAEPDSNYYRVPPFARYLNLHAHKNPSPVGGGQWSALWMDETLIGTLPERISRVHGEGYPSFRTPVPPGAFAVFVEYTGAADGFHAFWEIGP